VARRALIVGINDYAKYGPEAQLTGAIPDAQQVAQLLGRNHDNSVNYHCITLLSNPQVHVTRDRLRAALEDLFRPTNDEVLFYFSGHGTVDASGGYIMTQDATPHDPGITMDQLLAYANNAHERESVIILDCCMSGNMGNPAAIQGNGDYQRSVLSQNVTILAASRHNEAAMEIGGQGIFTSLLIDALDGTASDLLGYITLPSIYAHIEGSLGPWRQRPIYKTYTSSVTITRKAKPHVDPVFIRQLTDLFPDSGAFYPLTPEHEYDEVPETPEQHICYAFKQLRNGGLVVAEHPREDFYWTAIHSHRLMLTPLGRYFWRLAADGLV
jgi:hypothetical protein